MSGTGTAIKEGQAKPSGGGYLGLGRQKAGEIERGGSVHFDAPPLSSAVCTLKAHFDANISVQCRVQSEECALPRYNLKPISIQYINNILFCCNRYLDQPNVEIYLAVQFKSAKCRVRL